MPDTQADSASLLALLRECAADAGRMERDALDALHTRKDSARYRALMEERAKSLIVLEAQAAPLLGTLPEAARGKTRSALRAFADGARTALDLGSVFYMSALLYRDDHRAGEPDKLRTLLAGLENDPQ
ncbi:MAG: hypothetical protein LBQ51_06480 [Desulfovibrio sp.]|jgi:hypothetical protein|nr:hypothetical protein [Desulfovibrio sp.]